MIRQVIYPVNISITLNPDLKQATFSVGRVDLIQISYRYNDGVVTLAPITVEFPIPMYAFPFLLDEGFVWVDLISKYIPGASAKLSDKGSPFSTSLRREEDSVQGIVKFDSVEFKSTWQRDTNTMVVGMRPEASILFVDFAVLLNHFRHILEHVKLYYLESEGPAL